MADSLSFSDTPDTSAGTSEQQAWIMVERDGGRFVSAFLESRLSATEIVRVATDAARAGRELRAMPITEACEVILHNMRERRFQ